MGSKIVLGADIGGTHITTALVNISRGAPVPHTRFRAEIDADGTVDHIIASWANAIKQSWEKAGINNSPVGIAMPGPFDYENGICLIKEQKKYQSLYGQNIKELLAASLGILPAQVRFINDACSFLKGELLGGSVKGLDDAIGITLGTGLGSAYYKDGTLTDADLWKMPFKTGIAEDYLSTRWFVKECKKRFNRDIKGVKELVLEPGDNLNGTGALFEIFAENLALFSQELYRRFNCRSIVVGGNITKASGYFWDSTCKWLVRHGCPVKITTAQLGETASLTGAAGIFTAEELEEMEQGKTFF